MVRHRPRHQVARVVVHEADGTRADGDAART
jgi:hypothetical protein